ncbi:MAG: hypothetical protein WCS84_06855 [Nocardioides sp.]|jgi:transcriptional regulator NrdR family protein
MKCPACNGPVEVIRTLDVALGIRRRRRCFKCGHRFGTIELAEAPADLVVELSRGRDPDNRARVYVKRGAAARDVQGRYR